jgi:pimeloyl-ACP methyl ester carboxylesterase
MASSAQHSPLWALRPVSLSTPAGVFASNGYCLMRAAVPVRNLRAFTGLGIVEADRSARAARFDNACPRSAPCSPHRCDASQARETPEEEAMFVERTFDTGTVSINYAEDANAGSPLLMLHGLSSRWQSWLNVTPAFTQRWHVIAPDLRGHGRSGHAEGHYGLMEYAADVIALLRHLGNVPAVLVGQSLGSMISIAVASEAPDLVRAVVLGDPPLGAFDGRPFALRPEYPRFVAHRDLAREGLAVPELISLLPPTMPGGDAVAVRFRAASLHQIDPAVLTAVIENRSIENYDLGERLRSLSCPILMLQGNPELGGALTDLEARWAASLIPDCTHVSLPNVGHNVHTGEASTYVHLVTSFLESL